MKKGGVVICLLRPRIQTPIPGRGGNEPNNYTLLELIAPTVVALVSSACRAGEGSQVRIVPDARGASRGYFQVLEHNLRFSAYLEATEVQIAENSGTIYAMDSISRPISAEFPVATGLLSFVAIPHEVTGERIGAAIYKTVRAHFDKTAEVDAPEWVSEIPVPGANVHDEKIALLDRQKELLVAEISDLAGKRDELLNYRRLLLDSARQSWNLLFVVHSDC